MTGCCWACAAMIFALMYSNWAFRSGCFEPSSALRLDWRENPSFTNSWRTLSALIGCPISVRAAASFSILFDTQIKGRMGSPNVAGSTRRLSAGTSPGSFSQSGRRPPPARRTRPFDSGCASRSCLPRLIVERAKPGDLRNDRQTASTSGPHLRRRKQASSPLVELRADHVPSQLNGGLVDHATDLPLFAKNRNPQDLSQSDARPADYDSVIVRSVLRAGQLPSPPAQCPVVEQSFRHRYGPQLRRHETSDPHPMTVQPTVFVLQCEDCGRLRSTMRACTSPWPHVTTTVAPRTQFCSHPSATFAPIGAHQSA